MNVDYVIQTKHLTVKVGGKTILNDISLDVPRHSIYGFLGPNGAGKTTLIRALLNLLTSQRGSVKILNSNPSSNRIELMKRTGCLVERPLLYPHLTGIENLTIYQKAFRLPKQNIESALEMVQMREHGHQKTGTYSLGMKQRMGMAIALIQDPELLILDEPANGLDPGGIKEIREIILDLQKHHNKSIFISSHLLSEVEKISTHVGVINRGKLLFQGLLSDLGKIKENTIRIETSRPAALTQILNNRNGNTFKRNGKYVDITLCSKEEIPSLIKEITHHDIPVYQIFDQVNPGLEDAFFNLLNQ